MKIPSNKDDDALLKAARETLLRPLEFASKDDFAHLKNIKGLEELVSGFFKDSKDLSPVLTNLYELFSGFDSLDSDEQKSRISRAKELLFSGHDLTDSANISVVSADPSRSDLSKTGTPVLNLPQVNENLKKLQTPLQYVKGIGPKLGERLAKKGLSTVEDALYFLPIRYEDRSLIKKIKELEVGMNEVTVGEVVASGEARYGRRRIFEVVVTDGAGLLKLKWFNYKMSYMKGRYPVGKTFKFYGHVSVFGHQKEIIHPDVEPYDPNESAGGAETESIVPVYSQIDKMHQKTIRKLISGIVSGYVKYALSAVPADIHHNSGFMDITTAFNELHMPRTEKSFEDSIKRARQALVFDELFSLELGLAIKRTQVKKQGGLVMDGGRGWGEVLARFMDMLPFELTSAQERACSEIEKDMASPHPMNRLVQGDVGSGKTVISLIAALRAISSGYQAAIMAPTEILAEQHFLNTHTFAEQLGIKVVLLTGRLKKSEKEKIYESIRHGEADLVIGTHALIQKGVDFARPGLFVIDEQHRFGVAQRAALRKKIVESDSGNDVDIFISPDILVMTATPIPRTLSMTVFGELDVSIIDELPKGRKPITTKILRENQRRKAYDLILAELRAGGQAYIVYPLVEESEELSLRDATRMKEQLEKEVFSDYCVGLLHGRMKSAEKETVMALFKSGEMDVLVSTTVIEVGVDVPNASVIMIEHAERFGLAQLHQLRGRVGRGQRPSYCLLLAQYTKSEDTWKRLKVLEDTMDGFRIAEEDLKIRGPGDFLGTRQSGMPDFRTAGVFSDLTILKKARVAAFGFMEKDPDLTTPDGVVIKEILKLRWKDRLELAEVG